MPISLSSIVGSLPSDEIWGPPTTSDALVNGVPYAPYSKGDKLGRMADWTTEGKDRDGRGGRQQYNRNYRGVLDMLALYSRILANSNFRSTSLRRRDFQSICNPSRRRRILVLCCR